MLLPCQLVTAEKSLRLPNPSAESLDTLRVFTAGRKRYPLLVTFTESKSSSVIFGILTEPGQLVTVKLLPCRMPGELKTAPCRLAKFTWTASTVMLPKEKFTSWL